MELSAELGGLVEAAQALGLPDNTRAEVRLSLSLPAEGRQWAVLGLPAAAAIAAAAAAEGVRVRVAAEGTLLFPRSPVVLIVEGPLLPSLHTARAISRDVLRATARATAGAELGLLARDGGPASALPRVIWDSGGDSTGLAARLLRLGGGGGDAPLSSMPVVRSRVASKPSRSLLACRASYKAPIHTPLPSPGPARRRLRSLNRAAAFAARRRWWCPRWAGAAPACSSGRQIRRGAWA